MTSLLRSRRPSKSEQRYTFGEYLEMVTFGAGGNRYTLPVQFTLPGRTTEPPSNDYDGYVRGVYKSDGIVFACAAARELLLSEATFKWRSLSDHKLYGTAGLSLLENPWPNGTTGELLRRMEQDATNGGNAFLVRKRGDRWVRRLHPGRTAILLASESTPDDPAFAYDAEVVGYAYNAPKADPVIFTPDEVVHWSPIPDPEASFRGMSWLTPVIREVTSDQAVTSHKQAFFDNAATPNLAIKLPETVMTREQYDTIVDMMEASHTGSANAYKTLYLAAGADVTTVGSSVIDFKAIQGSYETRICAASRVPAVIAGAAEGLQGSSLNAGNFGQARRQLADGWFHPTVKDLCAALSKLVAAPAGSQLWYDTADIPMLREDQTDAASIAQTNAATIRQLIEAGYDPDSAVSAVTSGDMTLLAGKHTGMVSVQLQPPGATAAPAA